MKAKGKSRVENGKKLLKWNFLLHYTYQELILVLDKGAECSLHHKHALEDTWNPLTKVVKMNLWIQ